MRCRPPRAGESRTYGDRPSQTFECPGSNCGYRRVGQGPWCVDFDRGFVWHLDRQQEFKLAYDGMWGYHESGYVKYMSRTSMVQALYAQHLFDKEMEKAILEP